MIGVVLLAHEQMRRTRQLAEHLARSGCKLVIHVDERVNRTELDLLTARLADHPNVLFAPRRRCEWGTFSLVEASLDSLWLMLGRWPDVTHVCQLSGSCLPIKPIAALEAHLAAHPGVDFIESVSVEKDPWVVDGLSTERFTLYHPLPWRRYKRLFDRNVRLQRRIGIHRAMPDGLEPRIGSQWWCLSRETLRKILDDPALPAYCRFFRTTWIPDESFFQTLAGKHGADFTSTPLTFVRFDPQGKPHVFYDDHLDLLMHVEGFFARKIWRGANKLYAAFLDPDLEMVELQARDTRRLLRRFERAERLHRQGRSGLVGQGRHPGRRLTAARFETARPYVVLDGIDRVFPDLRAELDRQDGVIAHGHLFAPDQVEFAGGAIHFTGNLTADVKIRDHKPEHFLVNLVWIERGNTQCFLHDLAAPSVMNEFLLTDRNARILRLEEGWLLDLYDLWARAPEELETACHRRLERESALRAEIEDGTTGAQCLTVSLRDILRGESDIAERLSELVPEIDCTTAHFAAPRLPERFGEFLEAVECVFGVPPGLAGLRAAARDYETLERMLRRKV